jgi:hypothetical protein
VKQKVRAWVCMGGRFPEGREANLINDGPSAAYAVQHWPTPIVFSGWEIGNEIMTGARLREAPIGTPVRRAYELYNGLKNRQSWDQTAVLYAVRGLDGGLADYWDVQSKGYPGQLRQENHQGGPKRHEHVGSYSRCLASLGPLEAQDTAQYGSDQKTHDDASHFSAVGQTGN